MLLERAAALRNLAAPPLRAHSPSLILAQVSRLGERAPVSGLRLAIDEDDDDFYGYGFDVDGPLLSSDRDVIYFMPVAFGALCVFFLATQKLLPVSAPAAVSAPAPFFPFALPAASRADPNTLPPTPVSIKWKACRLCDIHIGSIHCGWHVR
jgi:hypothetical protein